MFVSCFIHQESCDNTLSFCCFCGTALMFLDKQIINTVCVNRSNLWKHESSSQTCTVFCLPASLICSALMLFWVSHYLSCQQVAVREYQPLPGSACFVSYHTCSQPPLPLMFRKKEFGEHTYRIHINHTVITFITAV